jgi:chorismate mutase
MESGDLPMRGSQLECLRNKIDRIDTKLMRLLLKRYANVKRIGRIKNNARLPVIDREREQDILRKIKELRTGTGQREFIQKVYDCIFSASYDVEKMEQ